MRASSLTNLDVAMYRELPTNFDKIEKVAGISDEIEDIAPHTTEIVTISNNLPDILTIQEAENIINNLGVTVTTTLPAGSSAEAVLNGTIIELKLPKGADGTNGINGTNGIDGTDGTNGINGKSAYQLWLDNGNTGSVIAFLAALKGEKGDDGSKGDTGNPGVDGASAYDIWVSLGNTGTYQDFIDDVTGKDGIDGIDGKSAYQLWLDAGNTGDNQAFLDSLIGLKGDHGDNFHHIKYKRSVDSLGNEVGPIEPGTTGNTDVYYCWTGQEEYPEQYAGEIRIYNGSGGNMYTGVYDTDYSGIVDNAEKLEGKTLTEIVADRDTAIHQASLGLGTNFTVANNAEKELLTDLTVADKVYVHDDGDGKWAQYLVTSVTDGSGSTSVFEVIMDEDTYLNANTKESVKNTYESNSNTNAFTDIDKQYVSSGIPLNDGSNSLPLAVNNINTKIANEIDPMVYLTKYSSNNLLIKGCVISVNAGDSSKFDVSPGEFYMFDNFTDIDNPSYTKYTYTGATALTPQFLATEPVTYLAFNQQGQLVQLDYSPSDSAPLRELLTIGAVVHTDNTLINHISNDVTTAQHSLGLTVTELGNAVGKITTGNLYGPAGTSLQIAKSAGKTFDISANYKADYKNPNYVINNEINPVIFDYYYRQNISGSTWHVTSDVTAVNPSKYDNGSGVLADVSNNKWSLQRVYYASGSNATAILYGQKTYTSEIEAIESISTDNVIVPEVLESLAFRGWVVSRGNAIDLSNQSEALFIKANKFGDVSSASGGVGLTTISLQQAYNNSSEPEITTNGSLGALTVKEGTGVPSNNVFEITANDGSIVASVTGEGKITGITQASTNTFTPVGDITSTNTQAAIQEVSATKDGNALAFAIALG